MVNQEKTDDLINSHWDYVSHICEIMYKTAFLHGYKHGVKDGCKTMVEEIVKKEKS